jgi:uncharacterized protein YuzE
MIQTTYDKEVDVLRLSSAAPDSVYDGSLEVSPGVMLEFDTAGRLIGIEIEAISLREAGIYGVPRKQAAAE